MGTMNKLIAEPGLLDILNFTYVPYGNAKMGPGGVVQCQHGPGECVSNMAEACVIDMTHQNVSQYVPYCNCLENSDNESKADREKCARKLGLDASAVETCLTNGHGKALIAQAAKATPSHSYVPYLLMDGKEVSADAKPILAAACAHWTGPKPACCKETVKKCMNTPF